ncbi:MAG: FHA domain-containing protein [Chloroflexi bacterium]|nr:MAG: FHA domain-containing protein [Chloroflexota bacterium]
MEELIGKTISRYKILALLGEGGMGAVFKAHDVTLQRDVAFKIMHPHFARQGDFKERFLLEARAAARLDHPSIVQVYDFGQANGMLYIVMEFIPGDNLGKMLQDLRTQNKWIDVQEAVNLVRLVSEALHYAHGHGILHRDIKPGNVMIEPVEADVLPYRPVLTDLGLAKLAGSAGLTQEGSSMGTPAYMSPEQALGEDLDSRSDVYSLGVLLFELVTGRLPFPARTISEAIRYHTQEIPPSPRSILPALPEMLEKVILCSLEKNRDKRYKNAADFAAALKTVLPAGESSTPTEATPLGTSISLITQYQQSLAAGRGQSVLQEFAAPADRSQNKIQVLFANKTTQAVPMKANGLVIGREDDSDIVVKSSKVSRHHTRIDFDGTRYQVVDLNSTNGTYLGGSRLLPGVPEEWEPEKVLQVGDAYMRLLLADKKAAASVIRSDGTNVDAGQVYTSPGEGRVGIALETQQLSVIPGQTVNIPAVMVNQGQIVDHFKVSVDGIPGQWIKSLPPVTQLMPGMQQGVVIVIQPPRDPQSRAGRYSITVRTASQTAKDQVAETRASLTVMPYLEYSSDMHPQRLRTNAPGKITLQNKSNVQETFALGWKDRADEIIFEPAQARLSVPAGQSAVAEFRAKPKQKILLGGEKIHPFAVQIQTSQESPQTLNGEVVSRAILPAWIIPVLLSLCVIASLAGFFVYRGINDRAEATTQATYAQATQVFIAAVSTQQSASQTVGSVQSAKQETEQAGTAIAGTKQALALTPGPTDTPTVTPTATTTETPTPTMTQPPQDGNSLNCDGTFQRFRITDAGSLGKTISIDNHVDSTWLTVFTISSGDPMERQFGDDVGLYTFGECQQLVVIPFLINRIMELAIYEWNGSGLTQVFYKDGEYATWTHEENGFVFEKAVYKFNEPACCPCYREAIEYTWNGEEFVEGAAVLNPTFTGTPPLECTSKLLPLVTLRVFIPTATP